MIESSKDEMFKSAHVNNSEQEERRMSDLSDFCASVTSSVDIQVGRNSFIIQLALDLYYCSKMP